jgi:hypothetical protein
MRRLAALALLGLAGLIGVGVWVYIGWISLGDATLTTRRGDSMFYVIITGFAIGLTGFALYPGEDR